MEYIKKNLFKFFAVGAALLSLLWHNNYLSPWMMDDSFIFFRYAENIHTNFSWARASAPSAGSGQVRSA